MTHRTPAAVSIRRAVAPADLRDVADLFREYQAGVGVDLCFQNFAAEVASLPGAYAAPRGLLLLCRIDGAPAGCAAVRGLGARDSEIKRVFVREAFRGRGLGERLVLRAIRWSSRAGYSRMLLDTLPTMKAAHRMYERLGFTEIEPYGSNPIPGTRFMARPLPGESGASKRGAFRGPRLSSGGGKAFRR